MQVANIKDIGADHTTVKQGCKIEEEREHISVLEVLSADHIRCECCQEKAKECSCNRDEYRYTVSADDSLGCLEDDLIRLCRKFSRNQRESMETDKLLRCEGSRDKKQERDQAYDRHHSNHDITDDVESL